MSDSRTFVDTDVIVYAHDLSAGDKRSQAQAILTELWESGKGCLSVQVLQEVFVTLTGKVAQPLDKESATTVVEDLAVWTAHSPSPEDVLAAITIHQSKPVSFWDAMILHSAATLGCETLFTEDRNPGQVYNGVRVHNPFAGS